MTDDNTYSIQIGENTYRIARFKGLKASLAGALMTRVMREVPQLQERAAAFRKEFREQNTTVITPALAKMPRFADLGLTDQDFKMAGGKIEFPEEPTAQAIMVNVFPDLFDLADKELRKFLAILVIPNRELEEADDADDVDGALAKWGKRLMREGDLDELLELVLVGMEVFREQLLRKRDRLGKILELPVMKAILRLGETEEESSNGHGETSQIPTEAEMSQPMNSQPHLFTDSQPDSDGVEEKLSTTSPGQSSSD